jgi:hypothetical protein
LSIYKKIVQIKKVINLVNLNYEYTNKIKINKTFKVINNKNKLINMKIKVNFIIPMIIFIKMINRHIKINFIILINIINKIKINLIKKNLLKIKFMIKINSLLRIFKSVKII